MEQKGNDKGWNPYVAGFLTGLLLIASVWFTGKYVGASTTFVRSTGFIEKVFEAERVGSMEYFKKEVPKIDWQFLFVIGIFIGSLIASTTSKTFRLQGVPDMWQERFGPGKAKRAIVAFIGGAVAIFGARLADGCPSGHGLSGSLQLAVSGYVSLICFFVGGIVVARILYKGGEGR
ncbi:MAG: putative inner membrane protein [Syntrophorhabdus sp. PtaU1.Bin058]|nr:MAG: putative inner membrane protein [Syntrophorhabdus sp. PtaU1.Bin058]